MEDSALNEQHPLSSTPKEGEEAKKRPSFHQLTTANERRSRERRLLNGESVASDCTQSTSSNTIVLQLELVVNSTKEMQRHMMTLSKSNWDFDFLQPLY